MRTTPRCTRLAGRAPASLRLEIPGDFSSAAPFVAAATLLASSSVRIHGVGVNPTRTGFLAVLERMGARIALFNRRQSGGEPSPTSRSSRLSSLRRIGLPRCRS